MEKTGAKFYKFGIPLWSKYTLLTAIVKTEEKRTLLPRIWHMNQRVKDNLKMISIPTAVFFVCYTTPRLTILLPASKG
jgi:hypothetical protein